jgi:hypothetical protein
MLLWGGIARRLGEVDECIAGDVKVEQVHNPVRGLACRCELSPSNYGWSRSMVHETNRFQVFVDLASCIPRLRTRAFVLQ